MILVISQGVPDVGLIDRETEQKILLAEVSTLLCFPTLICSHAGEDYWR